MSRSAVKIIRVLSEYVTVGDNPLRPLNGEEVKRLAVSMERIGLMTPITVRYHEDRPSRGDAETATDDSYELIAGRHRLAAALSLGWVEIDAIEIKCSDTDAKLWEIAENLHRAELTQLQRDKQVALWIKLTEEKDKLAQVAPVSGGRGNKGGVRAAARELGVERSDAARAVKVASLSDEAKAAAVKHGLDDNRSALLAAARESEPEDQVAKIVELAAQKTKPAPEPNSESEDGWDPTPEDLALMDRLIEIGSKQRRTSRGMTGIDKRRHDFMWDAISAVSVVRDHDAGEFVGDDELLEAATCAADVWAYAVTKLKGGSPSQ